MKTTTIFLMYGPKYEDTIEKEVATKRIVCPCCEGDGSIVNRNIGSFSSDDMDLGHPDDVQDYVRNLHAGVYDEQCPECKGKNVVDVPDLSELTPEELEAYERNEAENAATEREHQAELRAEGLI